MNQQNLSSFIWSVADLLRGDYKQSEYGKVILPLTVLRRLDCVLESTKEAVLAEKKKRENSRAPGKSNACASPNALEMVMAPTKISVMNVRSPDLSFTWDAR